MDLRAAATELYGVVPADFVATRTRLSRQARSEGDRALAGAIGALPKPTLPACAVNLLVRRRPDDVEQLLALGVRLRAAQASGSPDVRELSRASHDRLGVLRREAEAVARGAGQALSEPMAQRLQATLHAGMADPWAAQAVRSGLLVIDLVSTGLGPVDVSGAVAVGDVEPPAEASFAEIAAAQTPAPPRRGTPRARPAEQGSAVDAERQRAQRREAEETQQREAEEARQREAEEARQRAAAQVAEAEAAVDAARDDLEAAEATLAELERDAARREAEITTLTARLRELREARLAAVGHERRARTARDDAARALDAARKAADRARAAVPDPPA